MPKINVYITDDAYFGPTSTFSVKEKDLRLIRRASIERVINTSIRLVSQCEDEDTVINLEDWEEWKAFIVNLFDTVRNSADAFPFKKGKDER